MQAVVLLLFNVQGRNPKCAAMSRAVPYVKEFSCSQGPRMPIIRDPITTGHLALLDVDFLIYKTGNIKYLIYIPISTSFLSFSFFSLLYLTGYCEDQMI